MTLQQHLDLHTPIVWIKTNDPAYVIEQVTRHKQDNLFYLDPFEGLQTYKNNQWINVLVDMPDQNNLMGPTIQTATSNFEIALGHVKNCSGTIIITNADSVAEKLIDPLQSIARRYTQFIKPMSSYDKFPMQFILLSCSDAVPSELAGISSTLMNIVPSIEDYSEVIMSLESSAAKTGRTILPSDIDLSAITKAGLGMSVSAFTTAALQSVHENDYVSPKYILNIKHEKIKRDGILEIISPKITLDDIGGLDNIKDIITRTALTWGRESDRAAALKIKPIRKILLVGVPGTGKSAICEAAASSIGTDLARFGVSRAMNMFIGESERRMRQAFYEINALSPITLWIDEFGRDAAEGDYMGDSGTSSRTHGELLTGLQELNDQTLLLAAANRIDRLSPEMLRAGRFNCTMFVGFPTYEERMEIFAVHLGESAPKHNLDRLANATALFTGAEIQALIEQVRFSKFDEFKEVTDDDILDAAPLMRNRIWLTNQDKMVEMYRTAMQEWDWASTGQYDDAHYILDAGSRNHNLSTSRKSFSLR